VAKRSTSLSARDRQILLLAKTGIVTVEIVHSCFLADRDIGAAQSALQRLVKKGFLASEPLDAQRVYYRLSAKGARAIGISLKDIPILKKQGRIHRYAVTWFIQADRPGERALVNPHDYPEQFPVGGHALPRCPFFLDYSEEKLRLGIIFVDHNAHVRRMSRKTVKVLGRFLHHGWFDRFITQDAFVVVILTFLQDRKRAFDRQVPGAIRKRLGYALSRICPDVAESHPILVQVHVIPGLDLIVTHSSDQKGKQ
jgi:hypothetical protein